MTHLFSYLKTPIKILLLTPSFALIGCAACGGGYDYNNAWTRGIISFTSAFLLLFYRDLGLLLQHAAWSDTVVEIDEAYIGGQLRHKGPKMAKASKTMVIGMAERNGRIHLESIPNRRFESIKPVLDAKLAENTKEVVTDGNPSYKGLIPREKHSRGNHGKELRERVWTTTQTVENAFSLFKRAIVGNYHKLSPGTWIATCASSAGGTTGGACRRRSSTWRSQVWSVEHRYRTRRWLRSNSNLEQPPTSLYCVPSLALGSSR